jgi:hypothetical protein
VTVKIAIDEMCKAKIQAALSKAYVFDLRQRLSPFERIFGSRPIASVSFAEIETWLRELGLTQYSAMPAPAYKARLSARSKSRVMSATQSPVTQTLPLYYT